jgi:hypothetical protein
MPASPARKDGHSELRERYSLMEADKSKSS